MQHRLRQIIEDYLEAYNRFDVEGMLRHLHPEVVFEHVSGGTVALKTEGVEAFRQQALSVVGLFEERSQRIRQWEFRLPEVIVHLDYEAVLAVDLPNGLKAGEVLKLKGVSEFEFEGEQVIRITDRA